MKAFHLLMYIASGAILAYMCIQTRLIKENVGDVAVFLTNVFNTTRSKIFTKEELLKYNGSDKELGNPVFISVAGRVFDVTEEIVIYGTGGEMGFAAGQDISFMLATDNLTLDALDGNILSVNALQMLSLWNKLEYYENKFPLKGKLAGLFYDDDGIPAEGLMKLFELLTGNLEKDLIIDGTSYPLCMVEWKPYEGGGYVKCRDRSKTPHSESKYIFNIPVMYHNPGSDEIHCTCIPKEHLHLPYFHGFRKFDPTKGSMPIVA